MNCTELDNHVENLARGVVEHDAGFVVSLAMLLAISFTLLVFGERIVRPLVGILGGLAGAGGSLVLTGLFDRPVACEVRLVVAGVAAVIIAVLAICLLKTGLFLLGAFGLASLVHLMWESLPLQSVEGPFTLFSKPGWYYIAVGSGAITGAIVSQIQKKKFTRIASSVLGGTGIAAGIVLICEREGTSAPPLLLLGVVASLSVTGSIVQHYLSRRRRARKATESIPVGQPV